MQLMNLYFCISYFCSIACTFITWHFYYCIVPVMSTFIVDYSNLLHLIIFWTTDLVFDGWIPDLISWSIGLGHLPRAQWRAPCKPKPRAYYSSATLYWSVSFPIVPWKSLLCLWGTCGLPTSTHFPNNNWHEFICWWDSCLHFPLHAQSNIQNISGW